MFHTALSVMEHSGCPSGNVWWPQDRTVTISLIPPAGNRLVRHTPHRGSAHNYHLSAGQGPTECGLIAGTVGSLSQCSVRNDERRRTHLLRLTQAPPNGRSSRLP